MLALTSSKQQVSAHIHGCRISIAFQFYQGLIERDDDFWEECLGILREKRLDCEVEALDRLPLGYHILDEELRDGDVDVDVVLALHILQPV